MLYETARCQDAANGSAAQGIERIRTHIAEKFQIKTNINKFAVNYFSWRNGGHIFIVGSLSSRPLSALL